MQSSGSHFFNSGIKINVLYFIAFLCKKILLKFIFLFVSICLNLSICKVSPKHVALNLEVVLVLISQSSKMHGLSNNLIFFSIFQIYPLGRPVIHCKSKTLLAILNFYKKIQISEKSK